MSINGILSDETKRLSCMKIKKRTFDFKSPAFQMTGTGHLEAFRASKNDGPVCKPDWHLSQISAILFLEGKAGIMCKKFAPDELNKMDHTAKNDVFFQMQDRLYKLEQNYEILIKQVRLANQ